MLADRVDRTQPDSPYRRLSACRASLGFRGHFATKSRGYSTTLTALRRARHDWRIRAGNPLRAALAGDHAVTRIGDDQGDVDDDESTLAIKTWQYAGMGWATDGDTALAAQSAALALDRRHHRTT